MSIQIKPTAPALGAEAIGADLTQTLHNATFAQIHAAFYEHEVLHLSVLARGDTDQIRFSARFGERRQLRLSTQLNQAHPEIFVVSNIVKDGKHVHSHDGASLWHTDGAYLANPHAISA